MSLKFLWLLWKPKQLHRIGVDEGGPAACKLHERHVAVVDWKKGNIGIHIQFSIRNSFNTLEPGKGLTEFCD